jgi:hypothetical protein
LDVTAASATTVAASTGSNPWTSDAIQNALSTLNNSNASTDDQVAAYQAITDLISSHPSQGGAARVAVVTDAGFTNFAARTTQIGDQMEQGVTRSNTTTQQLSNFNALSSDDQEVYAKLNPALGTVDNVKANFSARIQFEQIVQGVLSSGNYTSLDQVNSSKYAALKSLGPAQATNSWTSRAQQVMAQLQIASQPTDKVDLSPAAQAFVTSSQTSLSSSAAIKPNVASNNADVGLQLITTARKGSATDAKATIQANSNKSAQTSYVEGSLLSTTV